eukprot:TRINITY_DN9784_c0_g2_i6.p1 TRINITY_DN9784_c0_g2~~TRINITY_DN9784_c0_g2_i6.p1  ORF type:complete len:227 (+),score=60.64 TRINITY_DN9784_c0_g2_i6:255-935(+)
MGCSASIPRTPDAHGFSSVIESSEGDYVSGRLGCSETELSMTSSSVSSTSCPSVHPNAVLLAKVAQTLATAASRRLQAKVYHRLYGYRAARRAVKALPSPPGDGSSSGEESTLSQGRRGSWSNRRRGSTVGRNRQHSIGSCADQDSPLSFYMTLAGGGFDVASCTSDSARELSESFAGTPKLKEQQQQLVSAADARVQPALPPAVCPPLELPTKLRFRRKKSRVKP